MRRSVGKLTLGIVLLSLGIALGLEVYAGMPALSQGLLRWWPLAIVLLGIEYIWVSRNPEVHAHISGGVVFLLIIALVSAWFYDVGSGWSGIHFGDFGNFSIGANETYTFEADINEAFGVGLTKLNVRAIGDVIIVGSSSQAVTGTATVIVRGRTVAEAKKYADEIKVAPRIQGNTLYLEFSKPSGMPSYMGFAPSFTLTVPEGADLDVQTVSGVIEVEGVAGKIDLNDVSGDISVDDRPLSLDVDLVSGDFEGSLGKDMEELNVKTVSGSVTIEVPEGTGGTVSAETVSGSIRDQNDQLKVTKSPGRSQASGRIGNGSTDIDVETVSGSVSFR